MNVRLRTAAAYLPGPTDRLTRLLSDIERLIQRLNLGVEAWIPFGDRDQLGYAYVGRGKWRLMVQTTDRRTPLCESGRTFRADAVAVLPELFDALALAAENLLVRLVSACELAQEMADAITAAMHEVGA